KNLSNLGVVFTETPRSIPVYMEKLITKISNSDVLKEHRTYIFNTKFLKNTEIAKNISYFIMDNNSEKSIINLSTLYDEFKERIDEIEKSNIEKND
ncbi:hypothetical protein DOS67_09840, partial [Staphylococcus felis]